MITYAEYLVQSVIVQITVAVAFLIMMGESKANSVYIKYSTATGYFLQDDPALQKTIRYFDYVRSRPVQTVKV